MKAALLCPGPSLAKTFDDDFAGWRVGVNRAALAFKCDWWSALDHGPIEREKIGGIPLITTLAAKQHLTAFLPERLKDFPRVVTCEDLYDFLPLHVNWPTFSAIAGLVLCAWLGATAVSVYGADWTEAADWDGADHVDNNRKPARWTEEAGIWHRTVESLAAKGVTVERIRL